MTAELELEPARFYIKRYIRYKYAPKDKNVDGVRIGELPERVMDKGSPGPGLPAAILTDKYVDHLPLYRQRQRLLRENIPIAASTLDGRAAQGMDRLEILWEHLLAGTKTQGCLQADETPIKVLDSAKIGACHQGCYWVCHSPIDRPPSGYWTILPATCKPTATGSTRKSAPARREFERALDNDRQRAEMARSWIQGLYAVERQAKEDQLGPARRKELRLRQALPIINDMGKWISGQLNQVLPKSPIGKAMAYRLARWDGLSDYLYDGLLEIDNNGVENAIRPVARGPCRGPPGRNNLFPAGNLQNAREQSPPVARPCPPEHPVYKV